jgi:hypothetical protein
VRGVEDLVDNKDVVDMRHDPSDCSNSQAFTIINVKQLDVCYTLVY